MINWKRIKLKELAKYINGKAFKPSDWSSKGIPIIRIENLTNSSASFNYFEGEIGEKYHISSGDMVLSWSATLDCYIWNREFAYLNQHIFKVIPNKDIDELFLYYGLKNSLLLMSAELHGSTMKHITKPKFDNFEINVPEKKEDQTELAKNIQSQLTHVDAMRQAALKQKEAAKALQSAVLREVFPWQAGESLPSGWRWEKVGKYAKFKNGLNYSSSDIQSGVKIVGVSCFQDNFYLDEVNDVEIREERVREEDYLKKNDILIVRSNGSADLVGRHLLYIGKEKVSHSGFTIRLRLDETEINPLFYMYFARSDFFKSQTQGQGANIKNVSQAKLSKVNIPLPETVGDQMEVVETIQHKLESTQRAISTLDTQLAAIEALPAAILREAFNFEITEK